MKRNPLPSLIAAIIVLFGAIVGYLFAYALIRGESTRVAELAARIDARHAESVEIVAAKKTLANLEAENVGFESYFVKENDIVPFLEGLEETARTLSTNLEIVSVSPEAGGANARLSVSFSIGGEFSSVLRTLAAIEYGPHDIVPANLTLSLIDADAGRWSASSVFSVGTLGGKPRTNETQEVKEDTLDI